MRCDHNAKMTVAQERALEAMVTGGELPMGRGFWPLRNVLVERGWISSYPLVITGLGLAALNQHKTEKAF